MWSLTQAELDALMERKREADRREDYRAALNAYVTYNMLRGPKSKAMKIEDFMPQDRKRSRSAQTPEETKAVMDAWVVMQRGR